MFNQCFHTSINGVPACANQQLLTNITRNEWGFKGYIVSDAGAVSNIISYHKYVKTPEEAAAASIKAGCNLELHLDDIIYDSTLSAMKAGLLTEKQIRDNVRPLMYTRMRLGEFDPEEMNPYNAVNMSYVQSVAHRALALQAAMKTFVLLKNDRDLLPLKQVYNKLAVSFGCILFHFLSLTGYKFPHSLIFHIHRPTHLPPGFLIYFTNFSYFSFSND